MVPPRHLRDFPTSGFNAFLNPASRNRSYEFERRHVEEERLYFETLGEGRYFPLEVFGAQIWAILVKVDISLIRQMSATKSTQHCVYRSTYVGENCARFLPPLPPPPPKPRVHLPHHPTSHTTHAGPPHITTTITLCPPSPTTESSTAHLLLHHRVLRHLRRRRRRRLFLVSHRIMTRRVSVAIRRIMIISVFPFLCTATRC